MKKLIAIVLVLVMALGLAACGGNGSSAPATTGGNTAPAATGGNTAPATTGGNTAPAATPSVTIQVGYGNNPGEPTDLAMNYFADLVKERSNGEMELVTMPSSQLGSQADVTSNIAMGEGAVIEISDGAFLQDYGNPEIAAIACPYLFSNWDECWTLIDSDWYTEQKEALKPNGIHVLAANYAYGARELMTVKPVRQLSDLKGLIVRCPSTPSYVKAFEYMGAAPTAMALGDVYTSTQQGIVEGMENPFATLYGQAYYEVAKYITMTDHILCETCWIINEDYFNGLTAEQQEILETACYDAGLYNNQKQDEMLADYKQKMVDNGVEIIELTDAQRKEFADAAAPVFTDPEISKGWRDGLYDYLCDIMGK